MKLQDYVEMAKSGISLETIHKIHTEKQEKIILKSVGDETYKDEAIIRCPKCV